MGYDGAWVGIEPWPALLMAQLNVDPPPKSEFLTVDQMRVRIEAQPDTFDVVQAYRQEAVLRRPDMRGHPLGSLTVEALNTSAELKVGAQVVPLERGRSTIPPKSHVYEKVCWVIAKRFLRFLTDHPEHRDKMLWLFGVADNRAPGGMWLEDAMKQHGAYKKDLEGTGFQYGWGLNAARRVLDLPPMPNPSIVTLQTEHETKEEFAEWLRATFAEFDAALKRGEHG